MPEILLVRHAQASFGAEDYDVLSPLGHRQSAALGRALSGERLGAAFIGAQRRHRETWEGIAVGLPGAPAPRVHPGLNEFDFAGLLSASGRAEARTADRRTHFRALREAVLAWQRDEVPDPPETWGQFGARVAEALHEIAAAAPAIAVSSGGAIAQMVACVLGAPPDRMIELQLQMRNCAVTRLIAGDARARGGRLRLHSFNEAPHAAGDPFLVSYA